MSSRSITTWVTLKPEYLGKNFTKGVISAIKNEVIGVCNKRLGYVKEIISEDEIDVLQTIIRNSTSVIVSLVRFNALIIQPRVNDVFDCVIKAVYNEGVLCEAHEYQKIFIPTSEKSSIDVRLDIGGKIQVKIEAVRYSNHKFSCIGVII